MSITLTLDELQEIRGILRRAQGNADFLAEDDPVSDGLRRTTATEIVQLLDNALESLEYHPS
jgi:hypothetical protein